jgi:hypothetical protein
MAQQNYNNHVRYYPAHHFIFYPVVSILLALGIRGYVKNEPDQWLWAAVALIALLIGWLSFMLRQHYALTLQNRMVIVEMRLRYYILTKQNFEPLENRLSFGQIAALRFAPDNELPALIERALLEGMDANAIKKAIVNWKADERRV